MIAEKTLSGTGTQALVSGFDKERAILVQWPAGLDTKGRPVYLRKWYHPCGQVVSTNYSTTNLDNTAALSTTIRDAVVAAVDVLTRIPDTQSYGLVAESGRQRSGGLLSADPPICHKYLEHHQLGDQWRG